MSCSDPEILAKEIDHLSKVLHYNNYPQWMINQWGKMEKQDPLIHPETGKWDTEMFLHLSTLFPRIEWILQENLQVHASTSMFQRSQHPEIHADAPKGQDLQWPKEGSSLPLGV